MHMPVDNMGDHVTVSTTQHHIAIPIEKLNALLLEVGKEEKHVTDDGYVDNVQKPEEKDEETEEKGECRYCQEEDFVSNMESPCNCNGSVKYVHKRCIDQWYNSKGRMILCEICRKPYNPNDYPLPELHSDDDDDDAEITILSEEWTIPGTNTQIQSPLVVADRATKGLIDSMNKDFSLKNPTGGVIFGMSLVIFIAVLLIKDAYECAPPKEEKFAHFLYCAVMTISVPVYILSWVLQCQAYRKSQRERERERHRNA